MESVGDHERETRTHTRTSADAEELCPVVVPMLNAEAEARGGAENLASRPAHVKVVRNSKPLQLRSSRLLHPGRVL